MPKSKPKSVSPTATDYENLGRALVAVTTPDMLELILTKRQIFIRNAVRGGAVAVGGVVALAFFALIIGFLINYLHGLPFLGYLLQNIGQTLQRK